MHKKHRTFEAPMESSNDERYKNNAAAAYIGVANTTLPTWRSTKRYNIPYFKVGSSVYYLKSDLDAWLESRKVTK